MVLGRYRLEPQYELGDPPGCYMHPDSLVSPSRADLRFALQSHLVRSRFYHAKDVLKAVEGTWLYEEQVRNSSPASFKAHPALDRRTSLMSCTSGDSILSPIGSS